MKDDYDRSIPMTLHILRNPYGWDDQVVREAMIKAADQVKRLFMDLDAIHALKDMADKANRYEESLLRIAEGVNQAGFYIYPFSEDAIKNIAREALKDA